MSALLKEHMEVLRMVQACDSTKRMGSALPDDILGQFTSAIASDDIDTVHKLLDEHFPDRTEKFPGKYHVNELYPCLSQAARHDQVLVLQDILLPYSHLRHTFEFVAKEAADACSKNVLLFLLDNGWDINQRRNQQSLTVLESFLCQSTLDRDNDEHRGDMAYWLINRGASLNARPDHIDTTGMSYAVKKASVEFVRELLDHHGGDAQRGQPLHNALCRWPQADIVAMLGVLLDRGAPLNQVMYAGDERASRNFRVIDLGTPLHDAAQKGNIEAVEYLLARGADTSIPSSRTKTTAWEWADKAGHREIAAIIQSRNRQKL
ncbi:hypothetical protein SCUCBS95973_001373 [Sporothrix curviconia]|uniref:Ankyrin repeat protein n=1 Tax=Sporothrix curviconia TaxID=1260050 RepID=A0ABP0AY35_9PEZI